MKDDKKTRYYGLISSKINELFEEDESLLDELKEGNNATLFFHTLANLIPCMMYHEFTGNKVDTLDFNHIANKLVFQYAEREK
jgi:hypothetical protein